MVASYRLEIPGDTLRPAYFDNGWHAIDHNNRRHVLSSRTDAEKDRWMQPTKRLTLLEAVPFLGFRHDVQVLAT
jgi:hypothetical protein